MFAKAKLLQLHSLKQEALKEVGKKQVMAMTQAQNLALGGLMIATIDLADFVYEYMRGHPTLEAARKMLNYLQTRGKKSAVHD
jgi:hypothetical protein